MFRGHVLGSLLTCVLATGLHAQSVDHWEAVAQDGTLWSYVIPQSQPLPFWMFGNFAETGWSEGVAGFGYGDGDDATEIPPAHSIYLRHTFNVEDLNAFMAVWFAVDYDDGYVAYLNGTEIGRGMLESQAKFWRGMPCWMGGMKPCFIQEAHLTSSNLIHLCLCRVPMCLRWKFSNNNVQSSDFTARPSVPGRNDTQSDV